MADELIVSACPECGTTYRLKPDMYGKRMRCMEVDCRAVFLVESSTKPELVAASSPMPPTARAVPVEEPAPVFDWRDAPPPVSEIDDNAPVLENPKRHQVVDDRAHPAPAAPLFVDDAPKKSSRRMLVIALAVFVVGGVGWGIATIVQRFARAEERLVEEASQAFAKEEFGKAADRYSALAIEYPRAIRAGEYRFLAELAKVRRQATLVPPASEDALTAVSQFVREQESGPFLKDKRADVYVSAVKALDDLVNEGRELIADKKPELAHVKEKLARQALALVERYAPSGTPVAPSKQNVDELALALNVEKARVIAREEIFQLLRLPRPDVEASQELIRRAGLANDAAIKIELARATEKLRGLVAYIEKHQAAQPVSKIASSGILPGPKAIGPGSRIPILARGVLAALDSKTGRIAWADRLGADVAWPPLKLDESRWLVVATEPRSVSARDVNTGDIVWSQPLESLPVGPPVVVAGRVFVAVAGSVGNVLNIDARTGELLGTFAAGQPLAGGIGTRPGTSRLYVPARAQQIYVLDAMPDDGAPRCIATFTTGHAPGSLRREPTIFPLTDGGTGLLLEMADGVADTALELFRLPDGPLATAVPMDRARVAGWTWFPPAFNAERLATVGDRGMLGVFGLRQAGASDGPMFMMADTINPPIDASPHRSLVLAADDDSLIAITAGRLRQWRLVIDRVHGRKLAPGWSHAEPVGVPIQPPTIDAGIAYFTTQRNDQPVTLVTAFRMDSGEIIWQRTLGFESSSPHVRIGETTIALDHRGVLFSLTAADATSAWSFAGRELTGMVAGLDGRPSLIRGPAASWVAVLPLAKGVLLRRIAANLTVTDQRIELPAALAGQPGFSNNAAVLPLANGVLVRLGSDGKPVAGPTWRSAGSGSDSIGNVSHWHDDIYLVGDGHRKLMRLSWPGGTNYDLATAAALERPQRFLGVPVVIPGDIPRAVVADAGGNVTLIRGDKLDIERSWRLGGDGRTITNGPTLVGEFVFVIVDGKTLVALQLDHDGPAWSFDLPDGTFIGTPTEFAGKLVIADSQGRLWSLNANSGKPMIVGGYTLMGTSVAGGMPVSLSANRLFVPLADGTGISLTNEQLLGSKAE